MLGANLVSASEVLFIEQLARDQPALDPPVVRAPEFCRIARRREHQLRRLVDMVGMALVVDALIKQRRIAAQARRNLCGNLCPGDAVGKIGLGAEQGFAVLAGERRGAAGGRRLLAQHQPVGAVNMVGDGQDVAEILQQALFLPRIEIALAPDFAGHALRLAPGRVVRAQQIGEGDFAADADRRKFGEISGDALGPGAFHARQILGVFAQAGVRPFGMGAHEGGDSLESRSDRMVARKLHSTATRTSGSRVRRAASPAWCWPSR